MNLNLFYLSPKRGILVCTDILSRGIDIDDVDWVVQYDPPKVASSFVHRCGRTARSGREGNAIIFLLPNEECYVNFLHINQQVPLMKLTDKKVVDTNQANDSMQSHFQGERARLCKSGQRLRPHTNTENARSQKGSRFYAVCERSYVKNTL